MRFSKIVFKLIAFTLLLPAMTTLAVGPPPANKHHSTTGKTSKKIRINTKTKLDVIVPVFDANFPDDPDDYEKEGVWPELRRAESNLFALRTRDAIEATDVFGAVRLTPNDYTAGDLYVTGKIIKSTSEEVEIKITVQDISLKYWTSKRGKSFEYRVREYDMKSHRSQGRDPYQPIYDQIASYMVKLLKKKKEKDLKRLQNTTTLVFARSFSSKEFSPYFKKRKSANKLKNMPADNDSKYQLVKDLRARDQVFIDDMQIHYDQFVGKMEKSYGAWQEISFKEAKKYRLARKEATKKAIFSGLTAIASIALHNEAKGKGGSTEKAAKGLAAVGGVAALSLGYQAFKENKASKVHVEALAELGQSIDLELAPQIIEHEGKTVKLTGTAAEQFQQWRNYLTQVFIEEATPNVQL